MKRSVSSTKVGTELRSDSHDVSSSGLMISYRPRKQYEHSAIRTSDASTVDQSADIKPTCRAGKLAGPNGRCQKHASVAKVDSLGKLPTRDEALFYLEISAFLGLCVTNWNLAQTCTSAGAPRMWDRMSNWRTGTTFRGYLVVATAGALLLGCGTASTAPQGGSTGRGRMKAFAMLAGEFVSSNGGRLPNDEVQLKRFFRQKGTRTAAEANAANTDDLFVSERDGQPLVVKYADKSAPVKALDADTVIAYETTGIGGNRLVALANGRISELDEKRFAMAMADEAPKGK
jgi:hypothetical protein